MCVDEYLWWHTLISVFAHYATLHVALLSFTVWGVMFWRKIYGSILLHFSIDIDIDIDICSPKPMQCENI